MKSDWDYAPVYLRRNTKQKPWRMVVFLSIVSVLMWAVMALFAKPIVIDVDQLKQAIYIDGKPLFTQDLPSQLYAEAEEIRLPSLPVTPPAQQLAYRPANQSQPQATIQWADEQFERAITSSKNSFNDSNYTPKQPASTYTPPVTHRIPAAPQQTQPRQAKQVSRERTAKWIKSWDGGTGYLAEWISVNNYIDGTSVCANHRRGSIEYRECRKGAKQHYHEECRKWRAKYNNDGKPQSERMRTRYCSAASSFSPMG
jgi:hypothetical protein